MKVATVSLLTVLLSVLAGCEVSVADQELLLRHDPDTGTLDVLFVYEGVSLTKKGDPEKALALVEHVLGGAPYVAPLPGWGFDFGAPEEGWSDALRAAAQGVSVREVQAYLDQQGRLSAYQLVRIADVEALLAAINASMDREFLDQEPDDGSSLPYRAWHARVRPRVERGHRWLRLEQGGLWLVVPGTGADLVAWTRHSLAEKDPEALPRWVESLSTDEAEGTVRARLGGPDPDAPRLWRVRAAQDAAPYDARLLEQLRAAGTATIRPGVERTELLELLAH